METKFDELFNEVWKAIETNTDKDKARNLAILRTELEKVYAYYRVYIKLPFYIALEETSEYH